MATDKLFSVAGISKLNGEYKVRFANDIMRIKVLAKHGHEDIRLADLEGEFTKLDAAQQDRAAQLDAANAELETLRSVPAELTKARVQLAERHRELAQAEARHNAVVADLAEGAGADEMQDDTERYRIEGGTKRKDARDIPDTE